MRTEPEHRIVFEIIDSDDTLPIIINPLHLYLEGNIFTFEDIATEKKKKYKVTEISYRLLEILEGEQTILVKVKEVK